MEDFKLPEILKINPITENLSRKEFIIKKRKQKNKEEKEEKKEENQIKKEGGLDIYV